ncbi:MAG: 50S ribosomal protein L35 [Candidatus Omnitrophica bacterium]|nr:50S ribosomal protein L35 [Candidatus Omnitrophota bacterium]
MPKLKTNKGAAKRFRFTKKGKVKKATAGKSHILTKKSRKRKRHQRKSKLLKGSGGKLIKRLMPYAY